MVSAHGRVLSKTTHRAGRARTWTRIAAVSRCMVLGVALTLPEGLASGSDLNIGEHALVSAVALHRDADCSVLLSCRDSHATRAL